MSASGKATLPAGTLRPGVLVIVCDRSKPPRVHYQASTSFGTTIMCGATDAARYSPVIGAVSCRRCLRRMGLIAKRAKA